MLFIGLYFASRDFEPAQNNILFGAMYTSLTTITLTLCFIAAQKNVMYIELCGFAISGTGCGIMAFTNYSGHIEMNALYNNQELCFALIFYILNVGLL